MLGTAVLSANFTCEYLIILGMHMGAPLIKCDYVIASLSPACAFYLLHRLLSLPFLFFFNSFPLSLLKK